MERNSQSSIPCDSGAKTEIAIPFLRFPNEIRNYIYKNYLLLDEGYDLNPHTNKLRSGKGRPIQLDLMYTCKRVAVEMRGLPLRLNTINFSAFHPLSKIDRAIVGRFGHAIALLDEELDTSFYEATPNLFHDKVVREISDAYPAFAPVLDAMKTGQKNVFRHFCSPFGQAPSACREFIHWTLDRILFYKSLYQDDFDAFVNVLEIPDECPPIDEIIRSYNPASWRIPTQDHLESLYRIFGGRREVAVRCPMGDVFKDEKLPSDLRRFRYSAAAAAIRFLDSIPQTSRSCLRDIRLLEDRPSVSNPECHGLGLIRFCQENPLMRIERRVSLWKTVFAGDPFRQTAWQARQPLTRILADQISERIGVWTVEALALAAAGMPQESFTLVFDGDSDGDWKCEQIFQHVVLRDAAWQQAMDECFKRGILPHQSWLERRLNPRHAGNWSVIPGHPNRNRPVNWCYLFDGFPQAMRDIVKGNSIVCCSFNPGKLWDIERLIEDQRSWSLTEWKFRWSRKQKYYLHNHLVNPRLSMRGVSWRRWKSKVERQRRRRAAKWPDDVQNDYLERYLERLLAQSEQRERDNEFRRIEGEAEEDWGLPNDEDM
ncbi:C6 transcription factor [Colletotrichum tofieldiae]|nr:C6 transcription factor [Colletotrichum tofieldiae]GKT78635.1 C6 transcription factor [Colletotrichum tofieldiae]